LTENNTSFTDRLWNFLCSLKLTIILLLLLAVTSILGTIIQQNASTAEYIREYGESTYNLFRILQFTDMYHSAWFVGILALFCLNLICCSVKNFPRVWRFASKPTLIAGPGLLKNSVNNAEFSCRMNREKIAQEIASLLKKEFAPTTSSEIEGELHLFAQKGLYSRFGAYITHLAILIIIAGAMIGNLFGIKGQINITEGEQVNYFWTSNSEKQSLGFTVRCENFDVLFYENSMRPKDYYSDLVITENGQPVAIKGLEKTRIEVNKPLTYNGYTFYQASYGSAGGTAFVFKVTDKSSGVVSELGATLGAQVDLSNGYSFTVTNYTDNVNNFGPAAQIVVSDATGTPNNPILVLKNYPDFDAKRGGLYSFSLTKIEQLQYTGLQVAKDPGVEIVWAGCFLLVFGSLTAFFFSHRRLWICLDEKEGKTRIRFIGSAHRNQPGFSIAFDDLQQKIATTIANLSPDKEK
jgi:cytochrome c biogenesis protein